MTYLPIADTSVTPSLLHISLFPPGGRLSPFSLSPSSFSSSPFSISSLSPSSLSPSSLPPPPSPAFFLLFQDQLTRPT